MTIAADNLPRPSAVDIEDGVVRLQSEWRSGGILRSRMVDAALAPAVWTLHYIGVRPEVAVALRKHWQQHRLGDFAWTPPGEVDAVRVVYLDPPSITWATASSASATLRLEQALAHD